MWIWSDMLGYVGIQFPARKWSNVRTMPDLCGIAYSLGTAAVIATLSLSLALSLSPPSHEVISYYLGYRGLPLPKTSLLRQTATMHPPRWSRQLPSDPREIHWHSAQASSDYPLLGAASAPETLRTQPIGPFTCRLVMPGPQVQNLVIDS